MRNIGSRNNASDWARLALKLGLLLTEPKVRAAVGEQLKNRVDQVTETVASKYEDAMDPWKQRAPHCRAEATGLREL